MIRVSCLWLRSDMLAKRVAREGGSTPSGFLKICAPAGTNAKSLSVKERLPHSPKARTATATATEPSSALRCARKAQTATATDLSSALRCTRKVQTATAIATEPSSALRCARKARPATEPSSVLRCARKVRTATAIATESSSALRCARKVRTATATGEEQLVSCAAEQCIYFLISAVASWP
jgi:hypothetical protein